ncbi:mitochondrial import receptor subunit TOM70-like isoform X2, partial [Leptotrombidium deliense]
NHALFDELYDAEKITKFLSILENSPNIVNRKAKIYLTKAIICFFNQEGTEAEKFADVAVKSVQKDIKLKVTAMIHWANSKMATPLYRLNSILSAELLKIYEDAILLDKDNIDIYYHRAYCYLYLKLYDKMLTELERCIAMDSTFEAPHFLKFAGRYSFDDSICVNAIEMQKMFQQFDQYIRDHPDSTDAPIHYSKILEESGESKKALEVIHKALQQNPDNATLLVQKAKRIIAQNPEASRPILLQALNLNYAYKMELFMMLAIVESYDGKLKSAVTYCDKAMAETRNEDDIFHCAALREQMSSTLNTLKLLGFHNEQQISSYCRNVFQEKKRKLLHSSAFKRFS